MNEARSFGASLRGERERRGVTLEEISERTKVSLALLRGLEGGDLTRWPTGIFRRSFVRGYAEAIGLDADAVLTAFARIFPDQGEPAHAAQVVPIVLGEVEPLRLTFDEHEDGWVRRVTGRRIAAAVIDLVAISVPAAVAGLVSGANTAVVVAVLTAASYHVAGVIFAGTSPGLAWLSRAPSLLRRPAADEPAASPVATEALSAAEEHFEEHADAALEGRRPVAEVLAIRRRDRRGTRAERGARRGPDSRAARH